MTQLLGKSGSSIKDAPFDSDLPFLALEAAEKTPENEAQIRGIATAWLDKMEPQLLAKQKRQFTGGENRGIFTVCVNIANCRIFHEDVDLGRRLIQLLLEVEKSVSFWPQYLAGCRYRLASLYYDQDDEYKQAAAYFDLAMPEFLSGGRPIFGMMKPWAERAHAHQMTGNYQVAASVYTTFLDWAADMKDEVQ